MFAIARLKYWVFILLMVTNPAQGAAASPMEVWRSDGEQRAQSEAIVSYQYIAAPLGRIMLIRDASTICGIRIAKYFRGHDATPGNMFYSGAETFSAEYEWYVFGKENSSRLGRVERQPTYGYVKTGATWGLGRLVLPTGRGFLKCGEISGIRWNYPLYVSMYLDAGDGRSVVELAPTGWTDFRDVNPANDRLRWYTRDEKRKPFYIPLSDLPSQSKGAGG
jgi:hypothetical protein